MALLGVGAIAGLISLSIVFKQSARMQPAVSESTLVAAKEHLGSCSQVQEILCDTSLQDLLGNLTTNQREHLAEFLMYQEGRDFSFDRQFKIISGALGGTLGILGFAVGLATVDLVGGVFVGGGVYVVARGSFGILLNFAHKVFGRDYVNEDASITEAFSQIERIVDAGTELDGSERVRLFRRLGVLIMPQELSPPKPSAI